MDNKMLQTVTDITEIKTKEQVRLYLKDHPEQLDKVVDFLYDQLSKVYQEGKGCDQQLFELLFEAYNAAGDDLGEISLRRRHYENNHTVIAGAIHNLLLEDLTFPTVKEIAERTNLSRMTVYRHLEAGLGSEYNTLVMNKHHIMADSALQALYRIGVQQRDTGALKAYIELSGASRKQNLSKVTNYIQINNLRLTQEDFEALPVEVLEDIEGQVKKALDQNKHSI